jgi:hypothetical protein
MRTYQTVGPWARSSLSRRRGPRHDGLMAAAALRQSESQRLAANDFETLKGVHFLYVPGAPSKNAF